MDSGYLIVAPLPGRAPPPLTADLFETHVPDPIPFDPLPKTFLGRVLAALAAVALIVVAVFFLTIALAIAGIVLAVTVLRAMWLLHRARRSAAPPAAANETIEVEYSVVVDERKSVDRPPGKP